jgi:hypothetical protein
MIATNTAIPANKPLNTNVVLETGFFPDGAAAG